MDLAVDVDVDFDDDLVVLDVFVAVLLLGAALAAGLVTFPLIVFAGALALGFVFGLVTFEAFAADNFAEALVVFLVVVALAGAFLTLLVDLAGAALVAAFFVLDAVFTTFAVLVGDFLAEGFVTFAAVVLGANSFLASLTGPEGPLGWAKSPFSTPFLNVALNNESKLGAFTAKLSRTNFLMAWRLKVSMRCEYHTKCVKLHTRSLLFLLKWRLRRRSCLKLVKPNNKKAERKLLQHTLVCGL